MNISKIYVITGVNPEVVCCVFDASGYSRWVLLRGIKYGVSTLKVSTSFLYEFLHVKGGETPSPVVNVKHDSMSFQ